MHDELSLRSVSPTLTLADLAAIAIGGANPEGSPAFPALVNSISEDFRGRRWGLALAGECAGGGYANSTISQETAIAWFRHRGFNLPRHWSEPQTLEDAKVRIRELTEALEKAPGRSSPTAPQEEGSESKIERTTLLILAALALEYAESRGPRFRGSDERPNVSALAADIGRRLKDVHGASNANVRARITLALSHYREEVGDTKLGPLTGKAELPETHTGKKKTP